MLLEQLTLCDFGLFRGEHRFSLTPQTRYGLKRPIVLFGGLNGAGKTTILSAIRLALYGRQSLGKLVSQKDYEAFLADRIHRSSTALVSADSAYVALEFQYHKLRDAVRYKVCRSWTIRGKSVAEQLLLYKNETLVADATRDQCQAFLNELVPIGVSDLFFFDGEKIASLAEDTGDAALRDAIRKLLGLDIIERLSSDLVIYGRRQTKTTLPAEALLEVSELEEQLASLQTEASQEQIAAAELKSEIDIAKKDLQRLEERLLSNGGAWGSSRDALVHKREQLLNHREKLHEEIRALVADLYPLTLMTPVVQDLLLQLRQEHRLKAWKQVSAPLEGRLKTLRKRLSTKFRGLDQDQLADVVQSVFAPLLSKPRDLESARVVHDLSERDVECITRWSRHALDLTTPRGTQLRATADEIEDQLASVSVQLERAPDEESLKADFDSVREKSIALGELKSRYVERLEKARRTVWSAIERTRKLKRLEEEVQKKRDLLQAVNLADATRAVLRDFSEEVTRRKIAKLEEEFVQTFTRLARKEDSITKATINPSDFSVTIYDGKGRRIAKSDLSAGEKQIYAVAMLDALARTSGRKLPVIIDTPLGRLDSIHRANLVANYVPYASHQVIVLSTDTEIDETFYNTLSKSTSHAYHLVYNDVDGASYAKEGFFWRASGQAEAHAS